MVEHPLLDREVVGSNPGRAIPKALKMVPVATLLGAQHYKAITSFSSPILLLLFPVLVLRVALGFRLLRFLVIAYSSCLLFF